MIVNEIYGTDATSMKVHIELTAETETNKKRKNFEIHTLQ